MYLIERQMEIRTHLFTEFTTLCKLIEKIPHFRNNEEL